MLRAPARVLAVLLASIAPAAADDPPPLTVTALEVVAERDAPQVCAIMSERLDRAGTDYRAYVEVTPPVTPTVVVRDRSLCVEGVLHGQKYTVTLMAGLPGAEGGALAAAETREAEIPNRKPALAFRGGGYILPRIGAEGLALRSINVDRVRMQVLRITDRGLVEKIYFGRISQQLSDHEVGELVDRAAQEVWKGDMAVTGNRNQPAVTAFPIDAVLGRLEPGVYIAAAATADGVKASQWFVVSDLTLNTVLGEDGLVVFARSLATAAPLGGVELRLLARSNAELGKVTTAADGIARFDAGALRGTGDDAPQALFARGAGGDFGFLDLVAPAFELADRSTVAPVPGRADAFLFTERGIYRPGEPVNLTALLRDPQGAAVTGKPLTLRLLRPDGLEVDRRPLTDGGAGAYVARLELPRGALAGAWSATAHLEPEGPSVGRVEFRVDDFVPPRLGVTLTADRPSLDAESAAGITIAGRFVYGTAAAGLPGELSVTLRAAENPYPQHPGYRFGLAQEDVKPQRSELPGFTTGEDGQARGTVRLERAPDSTRPLEAVVRAAMVDVGGRPVARELVLPVRHRPFAIGIRPRFADDAVPEGATVGFDVIAVAPDGTPIDRPDLSYELYEEEPEYSWFEANGRWDYKVEVRDRRQTGGTLSPAVAKPATVEEPVTAGRYRLEVFDPKTGVASSIRFAAGWWLTPTTLERPDEVEVTVMLPRYRGGETAWVHVSPPYRSQVLIAVADRRIRMATTREIGPEGAFLQIPVDPSWIGGVHVVASAFAIPDPQQKSGPRRGIGTSWLAVDPSDRLLKVAVGPPADARPMTRLPVEVTVEGAAPGQPAYVTLSAVDETVLSLTDFHGPDPAAHYFGPRELTVEMRDVYGRLVEAAEPPRARAATMPSLPTPAMGPGRASATLSLFSGIVAVGEGGRTTIPIDLPDFTGRLRLTAVAWTADRMGRADQVVEVRDPVQVDVAVPRHLAPGDRASVAVTLANTGGPAGAYTARILADGGVEVAGEPVALGHLEPGGRGSAAIELAAELDGPARLTVEVTGPDGLRLTRSVDVTVRSAEPPVVRRQAVTLAADGLFTPPPELSAGLRPGALAAAMLGGPVEIDVPGLLAGLSREPGGGAEAAASHALALLPFLDSGVTLGVGGEDALRARVHRALDRLLGFQRADGAFAAWTVTGDADGWLSAYALDVLGRARAAGFTVAEVRYRKGLEALKRSLENTWIDGAGSPARAYTLLVLARAKLIDAAPLRHFREAYWDKAPGNLPRAQLAAAFAALGDGRAAAEAFERMTAARPATSTLRDDAAVYVLALEGAADRERGTAAERLLRAAAAQRGGVTAQERAWLLLAARALLDKSGPVKVVVGDQTIEQPRGVIRRLDASALPSIRNAGGEVKVAVTVAGAPTDAAPAAGQGFALTRRLLDTAGRPAAMDGIVRNRLYVAVLEGEATDAATAHAMLTDVLPAGFEVETVRLSDSGALGGLSWAGGSVGVRHAEVREDRVGAVLDLPADQRRFRLVYLLRAVTPGSFSAPGAVVADLDRAGVVTRLDSTRATVVPE